jgi:hypothetical protein
MNRQEDKKETKKGSMKVNYYSKLHALLLWKALTILNARINHQIPLQCASKGNKITKFRIREVRNTLDCSRMRNSLMIQRKADFWNESRNIIIRCC